MGKRFWSLAISVALVGGVFSALPAKAQAAPMTPPAEVAIEDPWDDANYLNDQGNAGSGAGGQSVPFVGDNAGPADASTVADLGKIWFTNDAENITVYVQTQVPLGTNAPAYIYDVFASPGEGSVASSVFWCLRFSALVPGTAQGQPTTWQGNPQAKLLDRCNVGSSYWSDAMDGELVIGEGPDGTGVLSMTFPRSFSPLLEDGSVIVGPYARSANAVGAEAAEGVVTAPQVDNTIKGLDYTIVKEAASGAGKSAKPPSPPGKNDPPGKGKKKGCGKGKGKQKGACGKKTAKPAASCAPYTPGEEGAEAETSVLTEAATEENPVVVEYEAEMGGPTSPFVDAFDLRSFLFHNVQVDSASPDTGLYVRTEFTDGHDYDLALFHGDGTEAASSGESQPEPGLGAGSPEGAWEGGSNYEMLKGIRTADCAGYTARVAGYLTSGGPVTISMWLGPVVADPAAAGGGETAADMFFHAAGMPNPMTADSAKASGTPAANKGCKKGKGKKKGCKKPPVACSPYEPGEKGAEADTVTVTDSHTEEAPLIQEISLDPAVDEGLLELAGAGETPRAIFNVQVDGTSASSGLYVTFEFQTHRDYDLWAYFPDGTGAASSHGFQPLIDTQGTQVDESNTATNHGGESTATSENLVGIITPDCGGYTVEASNYLGEGGDFEIKLWLGEGVTDPGVPE